MDKVMIVVFDGCAPEYLNGRNAPDLFELARTDGFLKTVKGVIPSVTNVNHACILSGKFPEETKVVGNYYYNPQTKEEGFIEERGFMKAPTVIQAYRNAGKKTAFLTVKGKVLGVYGDGTDIAVNAQDPDRQIIERLGLPMPPAIEDSTSTKWIMQAALACVGKENPDFIYCTTNDYVFHHYAPGTPEADEQVRYVNEYIRKIHDANPELRIYLTADHGMNQKTALINFQNMADNAGLKLYCLPPLKDRYVANHIYQECGIMYIYLDEGQRAEEFLAFAEGVPEIERILTKEDAAQEFRLPEDAIGDYVMLLKKDYGFGEFDGGRIEVKDVRTHGSLYEREVPLFAVNPQFPESSYQYSKDIVGNMMK